MHIFYGLYSHGKYDSLLLLLYHVYLWNVLICYFSFGKPIFLVRMGVPAHLLEPSSRYLGHYIFNTFIYISQFETKGGVFIEWIYIYLCESSAAINMMHPLIGITVESARSIYIHHLHTHESNLRRFFTTIIIVYVLFYVRLFLYRPNGRGNESLFFYIKRVNSKKQISDDDVKWQFEQNLYEISIRLRDCFPIYWSKNPQRKYTSSLILLIFDQIIMLSILLTLNEWESRWGSAMLVDASLYWWFIEKDWPS